MAKQFQYQQRFEPLQDPAPTPFFDAVYPNELEARTNLQLSEIITPIVVDPVIATFFDSVHSDFLEYKKNRLEPTIFGPIVVSTPLTAKNWDTIYPDQFFRRNDYSDYPSTFELRRTITTPGAASNLSLIWFYNLRIRLDVKKAVDSGNLTANAGDVGGTTVVFNKAFKDIDSITVTVLKNTVGRIAVYDFVDIPNPVSFKILVFDTAGNRVTEEVSWKARGII